MENKQKQIETSRKKIYKNLRFVLVLLILGILIWGISLPKNETTSSTNVYTSVESGWTQVVDGEYYELDSLDDFIPMSTKEEIVLERIVDEEMLGKNLVFYAEQQEVVVEVGDCLIYEVHCPEYLEFFGSVGCLWINANIPEEMLGETITISVKSNFAIYHEAPSLIYFVEGTNISQLKFNFLWLRSSIAILVLGLSIITYLNARIWKEEAKRKFLFTMADMYLFAGLWLCTEVDMLGIVGSNSAAISAILSMIFIRMIPVAFYYFALSLINYRTWRTRLAGVILWGNLIVSLILQFVFGISMIHLIWLNMFVVIIGMALAFLSLFIRFKSRIRHSYNDYMLYSTSLLIIAYFIECCNYLSDFANSAWMGMALMIAFIIYAMIVHVLMVRTESNTNIKRMELEEEYNNLHMRPLNQQINAHFLFNSLNTISAYCKEEPKKADAAVCILSEYMYVYMRLVGENGYVELEDELDMIESYMQMQNMRFDDRIQYKVDNKCDEVMIPPLAIQTLVENAINHGLCNLDYCGLIQIKTNNKYDKIEILVIDNGEGFDVNKLEKTSGVGIKNLERRINAMGGIMTIESKIGKGTTVTLLLPNINVETGGEPF